MSCSASNTCHQVAAPFRLDQSHRPTCFHALLDAILHALRRAISIDGRSTSTRRRAPSGSAARCRCRQLPGVSRSATRAVVWPRKRVCTRNSRQPLAAQQVQVDRSVRVPRPSRASRPISRPADSAAVAERFEQPRQRRRTRRTSRQRRRVVETVAVEQHLGMAIGSGYRRRSAPDPRRSRPGRPKRPAARATAHVPLFVAVASASSVEVSGPRSASAACGPRRSPGYAVSDRRCEHDHPAPHKRVALLAD
jgi:hypothetical protein